MCEEAGQWIEEQVDVHRFLFWIEAVIRVHAPFDAKPIDELLSHQGRRPNPQRSPRSGDGCTSTMHRTLLDAIDARAFGADVIHDQ